MKPLFPSVAVPVGMVLAMMPTAAQTQQGQLKPGVLRPGPQPQVVVRPTPRPQEEIVLRDLPPDMLTIMQDADWPNPQRNSGILGVYRRGTPQRLCRQPADAVDLRRVRANGFRVVSYRLSDGIPPAGYKIAGHSNVRTFKYASPNSDRLLNAENPGEIDRFSISPQVWVNDIYVGSSKQRMGCAATWGLEIRVIGPKGINPYTGKPR